MKDGTLPASGVRRFGPWLRPTMGDFAFVVAFVLVLMAGQSLTNRDGDLGRHLTVGRHILAERSVPTVDLFSHSMRGEPFVPHEWLAEVAFELSYRLGAFAGVALLTAFCIALTFGGLAVVMRRRDVSPLITGGLLGLGVLTSMVHWAARPHVFSFVFVWIWATLLEEHRRGRQRQLWWLLPLTVVWANTHGAFIVGLVLIATYLLGALVEAAARTGDDRKQALGQAGHLTAMLALCVLVSSIHPSGFALLANSFGYLREGLLLDITSEYTSPDFHHPLFAPFLALLLLAAVVSVRRQVVPTLLLVTWLAFSLYSLRNIALFVIICLPLLAEALQDYVAQLERHLPAWTEGVRSTARELDEDLRQAGTIARGGLPSLLVAVVLCALLLSGRTLALDGSRYEFREGDFPVRALKQLAARPPGERLFNKLPWGGYILYAAWPRVPVFIDGQTDFYGSELSRDYLRVIRAEAGWQDVLDRHGIDWILVANSDPIARALEADPRWQPFYRDATAAVYTPREGSAAAL